MGGVIALKQRPPESAGFLDAETPLHQLEKVFVGLRSLGTFVALYDGFDNASMVRTLPSSNTVPAIVSVRSFSSNVTPAALQTHGISS
jgi:hypothetical protein